MSTLVVVESPAKAKTLERILGSGYAVEASYGHIRDLPHGADQIPASVRKEPWARLGVNLEKDFEPLYIVPKDKSPAHQDPEGGAQGRRRVAARDG